MMMMMMMAYKLACMCVTKEQNTALTCYNGNVVGVGVIKEVVDKVVLSLKAMKDIDVNARHKRLPAACRLVHVVQLM